jgi:hypothetical protein
MAFVLSSYVTDRVPAGFASGRRGAHDARKWNTVHGGAAFSCAWFLTEAILAENALEIGLFSELMRTSTNYDERGVERQPKNQ